MGETERIAMLEQENAKLKEENRVLLSIVTQMKVTLDRLLDRYIISEKAE
ncbi:hypothetical protein [Clostridium sp. AM58-1XD]|nr:hypothetical protein [Clostridium sp. AM58-1XD]